MKLIFCGATAHLESWPPLLDHTQLHTHTHTRKDSSERVNRQCQRPLPTPQTHKTNIHALSRSNPQSPQSSGRSPTS